MRNAYPQLKQKEVDFLIPFYSKDIQLTIDPALIEISEPKLYDDIIGFFRSVLSHMRHRKIGAARSLISFPEVDEIRLGYSAPGNYGKGSGDEYEDQVFETLKNHLAAFDRPEKRIEALYWGINGLAHDRLSDIIANIIKEYLISYTRSMADQYHILCEKVHVSNIFSFDKMKWYDDDLELPPNRSASFKGQGILFVQKNFLRRLPYFNFQGLRRMCVKAMAPDDPKKQKNLLTSKDQVIEQLMRWPRRMDDYISKRKSSEYRDRYPLVPYDIDNDPQKLLKAR